MLVKINTDAKQTKRYHRQTGDIENLPMAATRWGVSLKALVRRSRKLASSSLAMSWVACPGTPSLWYIESLRSILRTDMFWGSTLAILWRFLVVEMLWVRWVRWILFYVSYLVCWWFGRSPDTHACFDVMFASSCTQAKLHVLLTADRFGQTIRKRISCYNKENIISDKDRSVCIVALYKLFFYWDRKKAFPTQLELQPGLMTRNLSMLRLTPI